MGRWRRRPCEGTPCREPALLHPARAPAGSDPFFKSPAATAAAPALQTQDALAAEDEKQDPLGKGNDPAGKGLQLTGGKFGLDLFGGALKAEGKTFNGFSPYPQWVPGRDANAPANGLLTEEPGTPPLKRPGAQFMLSADLMKLIPWFRKNL